MFLEALEGGKLNDLLPLEEGPSGPMRPEDLALVLNLKLQNPSLEIPIFPIETISVNKL